MNRQESHRILEDVIDAAEKLQYAKHVFEVANQCHQGAYRRYSEAIAALHESLK